MVNCAILQLPTLSMSSNKLDHYLQLCSKKDVKVVVLGEYVLNSFFKELEKMPLSMIKKQSQRQIQIVKELCEKYHLTLIASIVKVKKEKVYKMLAKFSPTKNSYKEQNFLINYKHWNEEVFFDNQQYASNILYFKQDGLQFAVIGGFDAHFDSNWLEILEKKVDAVLVSNVATFQSQNRWRELLKQRAFLNGTYILRANRVGEFEDKTHHWAFYGDSLFISSDGEILSSLGEKEEIMICPVEKKQSLFSKKEWGFRHAYAQRGMM